MSLCENVALRREISQRNPLRMQRKRSKSWANPFGAMRSRFRDARAIREWRKAQNPGPPPPVLKHQVVRDYAERFGLSILVETGTFKGDMIYAVESLFKEVHSIELGQQLFEEARQRFAAHPKVHLHQGNSATVLPQLLKSLQDPVLFWLDGHFSQGITARADKDTPIVEEIAAIYAHNATGHVVLIDDARLFTGANDYPSLEELRRLLDKWSPGTKLHVSDDIIRLHKH